MNALTGYPDLLATCFRQDRVRIGLWIWLVPMLCAVSFITYTDLFPDAPARHALAASVSVNPAALLVLGPGHAVDTAGGFTAWRTVVIGGLVVALSACFVVIRHTRTEEDTGRAELVSSTVVGRHSQLAAATTLASAEALLTGFLTAVLLLLVGADPTGAAVLGGVFTTVGLVFVGVGAVAAQIAPLARAANSLALGVVFASFLVRAFGDASGDRGWITWWSPLGWAVRARAFENNDWAVLLLPVLTTVALLITAHAIRERRDLGQGLLAARRGRPRGGWDMNGVWGLAYRLQAPALWGWGIALVVLGAIFGALTGSMDELLGAEGMQDALVSGGGAELGDAYVSAMVSLVSFAAGVYGVQAVMRLRNEEESGRAEALLASASGRAGWYLAHAAYGFLGSALLCTVGGAALTATATRASTPPLSATDVMSTVLLHIPAVWLFVGVAALLVGAFPVWSPLAWGQVGTSFLLTFLGPMMDLPDLALKVSPLAHVPARGAESLGVTVAALTGLSLFALLMGLGALNRRDLRVT